MLEVSFRWDDFHLKSEERKEPAIEGGRSGNSRYKSHDIGKPCCAQKRKATGAGT